MGLSPRSRCALCRTSCPFRTRRGRSTCSSRVTGPRPPATSRAAHARPDSRPVTASPRGPLHRLPTKRVLSGRLRPAHHPFPGHTPPAVGLATWPITPIRRPGRLETSRQRHGSVAGHVSGPYPRMPAYQDVGCATPGARPYAVVRRTRRRGGAVRGAAVPVGCARPRGVRACCVKYSTSWSPASSSSCSLMML